MFPTFIDGDHVLTFNWSKILVGNAVVFKSDSKNYLKRIKKISEDLIYLEGDNKKQSSKFKPIKLKQIIGKVILKY